VVDANDIDRINEAAEELYSVMDNDLLRGAALLVFANKMDLPNSMTTSTVADKLQLTKKFRTTAWHIQGTVATTGEGLYEGLDWLSATLSKKR